MGEVTVERVKSVKQLGPVKTVTVAEKENTYLRIDLDHRDQSVSLHLPNSGWFWLSPEEDATQSIDDVIEALELAKQHLAEARAAEAGYQ